MISARQVAPTPPLPREPGPFRWSRSISAGVVLQALMHAGIAVPAFASCSAPANVIEAENCLPGSPPNAWDVGAGSPNIQGFATDVSVNVGQTIFFKVATNAQAYRIDIYRLGYYGGNGARLIASVSPSASLPQAQPACLADIVTRLLDCGNWAVSASWTVPAAATSGIYLGKLVRPDTGEASLVLFVVRNDSSRSDIVVQTSDPTWQAYNDYGASGLYIGSAKVSYNRPLNLAALEYTSPFSAEYPMLRWLEANGYDVSYQSGADTDRFGTLIAQHRIFMSSGHDEYWSGGQRASVEAARAAGVNLGVLFGGVQYDLRFVFYIVNSGQLVAMEADTVTGSSPLLAGVVLQQQTPAGGFSNASLDGGTVLSLTGLAECTSEASPAPVVRAGVLVGDGAGSFNLSFDQNCGGINTASTGSAGTYTVAPNGRASIVLGRDTAVAYLIGSNQVFFLGTDSSVLFGPGDAQAPEPFDNASVVGSYVGWTTAPATSGVEIFSGAFSADGASPTGSMTGTRDQTTPTGPDGGVPLSATYSVSSSPTNGRAPMTVTSGSQGSAVAYVVSSSKLVMVPMSDPSPAIVIFEQSPPTLSSLR